MKISDIVERLEYYKMEHGDVDMLISGLDDNYGLYFWPWEDFEIGVDDGKPYIIGIPNRGGTDAMDE